MTKNVHHIYYITHDDASESSMVGGYRIEKGHVKSQHEPERVWTYMQNDGSVTSIRGTHIGEYDKVLPYALAWRDMKNLIPFLIKARDGEFTEEDRKELESWMPEGSEERYVTNAAL